MTPQAYGWMRWPVGGMMAPLDPYTFSQVWINRKGWEAPQLVDPNRLDPMMNAVGLEWQPAHAVAERDTVH